ncbi:MAG: hypothetical protein IPN29_14515 [Saprospiraceae bacterium]|nr:hypothetical protein [Saprospiraceae bacterium]
MGVKNILVFVFYLLLTSYGQAQFYRPIGSWQDHLNMRSSAWVTQNTEEIIVSTGTILLFIDKEDGSYRKMSKTNGLSESQIARIQYNQARNQLIVVYTSGAFDIVTSDEVIYVTAIRDNNNIGASRNINDIYISEGRYCYFATSFGIVEYDLEKIEFRSTTFTKLPAYTITADDQYIYAGLDDGIYRIEKNATSKENFSLWTFLSSANGLPAVYQCTQIAFFNNRIYAVIEDDLYTMQPDGFFSKVNINKPSGFAIQWLSSEGKHLIAGLRDNQFSSTSRFIDESGAVINGGGDCINRTLYGIEDETGRIWYADEWRQIRYTNSPSGGCQKLEYDSPYSFESAHIEIGADKVYFAAGGANENYQIDFNRSGVYILNASQHWTNINEEYFPEIKDKDFIGFVTVAPHPTDTSLIYMGSFLSGLAEYNSTTGEFRFFSDNSANGKIKSSLQSIVGAPGQVRVSHIQFDKNGNLWVANFGAPRPISVFTAEGKWYNFASPGPTLLTKMAIDDSGNKWFATTGSSPAVVVFNENGSPDDPSDDQIRVLNSSNSLITRQVNSVETDLNGDVWVGTSEGPIIFECDPFDEDCRGTQRKVLQDSIAALLLETEEIFCIETDGANRKWFGTRNGIFVQSPDGETQELRFTEENSPLLHNQISDLEFDGQSGVMYISTQLGIQSYKTDATSGGKKNSLTAYAYPNPVRPEYIGPIAIKGLARDADVKITDVSGRLVYQTKATGGQAIWDGNDYTGQRADTGVYLVFSASELDPTVKDVIVTKILLVK